MGLDVYLSKCADLSAVQQLNSELSARTNEVWEGIDGDYKSLTEDQKDECRDRCKKIANELGFPDQYADHPSVTNVQEDSKVHPDHMFKIGYLRSSYNQGGINNVLRQAGVSGLYEIFDVEDGDPYEIKPDWAACLARCNAAIDAYRAHLESSSGGLNVIEVSQNVLCSDKAPEDAAAALRIYANEVARHALDSDFDAYSNGLGDFWLSGLKVRAVIPRAPRARPTNAVEAIINSPSFFLIADKDDFTGPESDWYFQALEVTKEMIEFVLADEAPEQFYLRWSA